jgi:hypothetical protein
MILIEKIAETIGGETTKHKKITPDALKNLGYSITTRHITIGKKGNTDPVFVVNELIENDDKLRTLDFCYLYSLATKTGIILNHSYNYFLSLTPKE